MDYNTTVSTMREIARDTLRLLATNHLRDHLLETNNKKDAANTIIETAKKNIAQRKFNMSKIDPEDPSKDEQTKAGETYLKDQQDYIDTVTKTVNELDKEIKDINEKIENVQNGTVKVCKEELSSLTEELILTNAKARASKETEEKKTDN